MPTIYWRVTLPPELHIGGTFSDLKTLRGATKRLMQQFPDWTEIEARFSTGEFLLSDKGN